MGGAARVPHDAAVVQETAMTHPAPASVPPGIRLVPPPVDVPAGYVGPAWLPGTGRMVWWTGRVAIGLRHEPPARGVEASASSRWVQALMLG